MPQAIFTTDIISKHRILHGTFIRFVYPMLFLTGAKVQSLYSCNNCRFIFKKAFKPCTD